VRLALQLIRCEDGIRDKESNLPNRIIQASTTDGIDVDLVNLPENRQCLRICNIPQNAHCKAWARERMPFDEVLHGTNHPLRVAGEGCLFEHAVCCLFEHAV
jgi:hypothetical protein